MLIHIKDNFYIDFGLIYKVYEFDHFIYGDRTVFVMFANGTEDIIEPVYKEAFIEKLKSYLGI